MPWYVQVRAQWDAWRHDKLIVGTFTFCHFVFSSASMIIHSKLLVLISIICKMLYLCHFVFSSTSTIMYTKLLVLYSIVCKILYLQWLCLQGGYYRNISNSTIMTTAAIGLFSAAGCIHALKRWRKQTLENWHKL